LAQVIGSSKLGLRHGLVSWFFFMMLAAILVHA